VIPVAHERINDQKHAEAKREHNNNRNRRVILCFNCGGRHKAANCPVRGGLVHEAPIPLRNLEGLPAAAAILAVAPEAANPNAGDDPRIDVPVQPKETEVDKRDRLCKAFRANLMDKATSMFMTKDFDSVADKKIVMQALVQLSRKEKAYEFHENPSDLIAEVYAKAMRKALMLRCRTADNVMRAQYRPVYYRDRWESLTAGLGGSIEKKDNKNKARKTRGDVHYLKAMESATPFSEFHVSYRPWVFRPAQVLRLLVSIAFEKAVMALIMMFVLNFRHIYAQKYCDTTHGMPNEALQICDLELSVMTIGLVTMAINTYETYYAYRYGFQYGFDFVMDCLLRWMFHWVDAMVTFGGFYRAWGVDPRYGGIFEIAESASYFILVWHIVHNFYWIFIGCDVTRCYDLLRAIQTINSICLADDDSIGPSKPVQSNYHSIQGDYECRPTVGARVFMGIKGIVPTVFSGCSHNEKISMDGRVGKKLPMHDSKLKESQVLRAWKGLIKGVSRLFELVPRAEEVMDFDEWAHTFTPNRRRDLLRTRDNTNDMPDLIAKSFIKKEIAPKAVEDCSFKDPRFIQGCPLELSAKVGPHLRPWTKQIVASIGPETFNTADLLSGKQIFYTCGRSNEEIGDVFRKAIDLVERAAPRGSDIVFLEDDQSRFDLHMGEGPFRFLKAMYRKKLPRRVARLLERKTSVGVSNLGTRYKIPFTMQSGWPDTSVGDTLVNAAMKMMIHGEGRPWVSIICGDDSVTVTTHDEIVRLGGVDGIIKKYASFGMEVEATVRDHPLDVEFCSGRFYPVGDTYVLFPRPGRLLAKIGCDMVERSSDDRVAWARGITSTLEYYGRVDPLCRAVAISCRKQLGNGREIIDREWDGKSHSRYEISTVPFDCYTYYDHHYGLNVAQVDRLCHVCSQMCFGVEVDDSTLRELVLHDL
jgi:hypothetical protein